MNDLIFRTELKQLSFHADAERLSATAGNIFTHYTAEIHAGKALSPLLGLMLWEYAEGADDTLPIREMIACLMQTAVLNPEVKADLKKKLHSSQTHFTMEYSPDESGSKTLSCKEKQVSEITGITLVLTGTDEENGKVYLCPADKTSTVIPLEQIPGFPSMFSECSLLFLLSRIMRDKKHIGRVLQDLSSAENTDRKEYSSAFLRKKAADLMLANVFRFYEQRAGKSKEASAFIKLTELYLYLLNIYTDSEFSHPEGSFVQKKRQNTHPYPFGTRHMQNFTELLLGQKSVFRHLIKQTEPILSRIPYRETLHQAMRVWFDAVAAMIEGVDGLKQLYPKPGIYHTQLTAEYLLAAVMGSELMEAALHADKKLHGTSNLPLKTELDLKNICAAAEYYAFSILPLYEGHLGVIRRNHAPDFVS
ncbi:hypothetical protein CHS0354_018384 [Potamilus streckersoni]|uniref:Uncharacterized protein n=1 Tax=Potamilus streckersoni TaxID=2493646 RepID=A0AAE0TBH0_9BIVA|nr:hypothetical protein CHS0354_018384 [Potamilus streckersoni]